MVIDTSHGVRQVKDKEPSDSEDFFGDENEEDAPLYVIPGTEEE